MIINQLSCLVGIIGSYILSYNKMNKKRFFVLCAVAFVNMLLNAILLGDLTLDKSNGLVINQFNMWVTFIITVIAFAVVFICNQTIEKPFGRKKLSSKIISFTNKANPNNDLNIMAGDLTFFGNYNDMDNNAQVRELISKKFRRINIICKLPQKRQDELRIGKLLHLLDGVQVCIKFYSEDLEDLGLRYRQITTGDSINSTINIYKFVAETDYLVEIISTISSDRIQRKRQKTFEKLWKNYWSNLEENQQIIRECKQTYENEVK